MRGRDYRIENQIDLGSSYSSPYITRWSDDRLVVSTRYTGGANPTIRLYLYSYSRDGFALLDSLEYAPPTGIISSLGNVPIACFDDTSGVIVWHDTNTSNGRLHYPWLNFVSIAGDSLSIGSQVQVDSRSVRISYERAAVAAVSSTKGVVFWYRDNQPFDTPPNSAVITRSDSTISVGAPYEWGTSFAEDMHHNGAFIADGRVLLGTWHESSSGGTWYTVLRMFGDDGGEWDDITSSTFEVISGGTSGLVMYTNRYARVGPDTYSASWMNVSNGSNFRYLMSRATVKSGDTLTLAPQKKISGLPDDTFKRTDGTSQKQSMHGWPDAGDGAFLYLNHLDTSKLMATELRYFEGDRQYEVGDEFELLDLPSEPAEFHTSSWKEDMGFLIWRVGSDVSFGILRREVGFLDGVGASSSAASASIIDNVTNLKGLGESSSGASADLETLFEPTLWAFDLTNAYGFKEKGGTIPSAIEGVGSIASSASANLVSETEIEGGVGASASSAEAEMEFAPPSPSGTCDWVEIGTADIGSAYSNTTRITVREIDQYRLLVLAPDMANGNTAWSLVHTDFWGIEVISSGIYGSFAVIDAFPIGDGKLLAHSGGSDPNLRSFVIISVSGSSVDFGSATSVGITNTPTTSVSYGSLGVDQFVMCWGTGVNANAGRDALGGFQWARAWGVSGLEVSGPLSDEQMYADLRSIGGHNNTGLDPAYGVHHWGDGILMPFGIRYRDGSRTSDITQGQGLIMTWDGANFNFVHGPSTWYTNGGWYYGSGGQRNPHFWTNDGGDCVATYAVYDNVSGYDHGFHRYKLNSTNNGITSQSVKHGIGLAENSLAAISLGETTIAMGDQNASRATSPRAVNICTMDGTWSMHSYHSLPHSATQYGVGCGTTDRIAVGVWGDGNDVRRKLRAWYR